MTSSESGHRKIKRLLHELSQYSTRTSSDGSIPVNQLTNSQFQTVVGNLHPGRFCDQLTLLVEQNTWDLVGGTGTLIEDNRHNLFVASQTDTIHTAIAKFLQQNADARESAVNRQQTVNQSAMPFGLLISKNKMQGVPATLSLKRKSIDAEREILAKWKLPKAKQIYVTRIFDGKRTRFSLGVAGDLLKLQLNDILIVAGQHRTDIQSMKFGLVQHTNQTKQAHRLMEELLPWLPHFSSDRWLSRYRVAYGTNKEGKQDVRRILFTPVGMSSKQMNLLMSLDKDGNVESIETRIDNKLETTLRFSRNVKTKEYIFTNVKQLRDQNIICEWNVFTPTNDPESKNVLVHKFYNSAWEYRLFDPTNPFARSLSPIDSDNPFSAGSESDIDPFGSAPKPIALNVNRFANDAKLWPVLQNMEKLRHEKDWKALDKLLDNSPLSNSHPAFQLYSAFASSDQNQARIHLEKVAKSNWIGWAEQITKENFPFLSSTSLHQILTNTHPRIRTVSIWKELITSCKECSDFENLQKHITQFVSLRDSAHLDSQFFETIVRFHLDSENDQRVKRGVGLFEERIAACHSAAEFVELVEIIASYQSTLTKVPFFDVQELIQDSFDMFLANENLLDSQRLQVNFVRTRYLSGDKRINSLLDCIERASTGSSKTHRTILLHCFHLLKSSSFSDKSRELLAEKYAKAAKSSELKRELLWLLILQTSDIKVRGKLALQFLEGDDDDPAATEICAEYAIEGNFTKEIIAHYEKTLRRKPIDDKIQLRILRQAYNSEGNKIRAQQCLAQDPQN